MLLPRARGRGSNFASKWSALGRDRVLTESYDVTRALVNTEKYEARVLPAADFPNISYGFQWNTPADEWKYGDSYVVPSEIDEGNGVTRGLGRFPTISELSFLFIRYEKDERAQPTDPPDIHQKMRVILLLQPYTPTLGQAFMGSRITITGLDGLALVGPAGNVPLNFPNSGTLRYSGVNNNNFGYSSGDSFRSFDPLFIYNELGVSDEGGEINFGRALGTDDEDKKYPFFSNEIDVTNWTGGFAFKGANGVKVELKQATAQTLQTINLDVPDTGSMALPDTDGTLTTGSNATTSTVKGRPWAPRPIPGGYTDTMARCTPDAGLDGLLKSRFIRPGDILRSIVFKGNPSVSDNHGGDLRVLALTSNVPKEWFTKHPLYDTPAVAGSDTGHHAYSLRNNENAFKPAGSSSNRYLSQTTVGPLNPTNATPNTGGLVSTIKVSQKAQPVTPINLKDATGKLQASIGGDTLLGDWGGGYGFYQDGSVVAPIECASQTRTWAGYHSLGNNRRQDNGSLFEPTRMIPSPAVFGDLLTTESQGNLVGWQTLLFNPMPAADTSNFGLNFSSNAHPGAKNPPDHLWMEFFWMPLVEPFALSESCSTLGKVNPNYQIAPFGYIQRTTGLQAALKTVRIGALSDAFPASGTTYKKFGEEFGNDEGGSLGNYPTQSRFPVSLSKTDGTLKIFDDFFGDGTNALRTASEICALPLVPQGETNATIGSWWNAHKLTSDTLRESPYKQLYSRITTKSNTYTVHYRVQVLKQSTADRKAGTWKENPNAIVGEYRGATTIERYIDPLTSGLPDYAKETDPRPLSDFYRFRTIANHQFIP